VIQLQMYNCRPADGRSPSNFYPIDGEVAGPSLCPRLEQRSATLGVGVKSVGRVGLPAIAGRASEAEVGAGRLGALAQRPDVVILEDDIEAALARKASTALVSRIARDPLTGPDLR